MSGLSGWKLSAAFKKTFRSSSVPVVLALPIVLSVSFIAIAVAADTISEKFQKKLEAADAAYQTAVQKAENTKFYAVQKATADRVKVLKQAMTEATKSGDLDAANAFKARIAAAEQAGGTRAKPKNVVKFGGHEYALIEEKATWHVAKRICEEMGGHLAAVEAPQEQAFLQELCGKEGAWVGASDADREGKWQWVTGSPVPAVLQATWVLNNMDDIEHALVYWPPSGSWEDGIDSHRYAFVCEWE